MINVILGTLVVVACLSSLVWPVILWFKMEELKWQMLDLHIDAIDNVCCMQGPFAMDEEELEAMNDQKPTGTAH